MKPNIRLLSAIRQEGFRQRDFARAVNEHETFVSRVVNGWINLDERRKIKFAKILRRKPDELFD